MSSFYQFISRTPQSDGSVVANYKPTLHSQGAWNPHEQHMAPATGIICHELEHFNPRDDVRLGRISLDIFGLISLDDFSISTRVIRPGKTIELVEAQMISQSKTCIVARAWRMKTQDTSAIAGLEDDRILHPEEYPTWDGMTIWPGGYIKSINGRTCDLRREGKGIVWLNHDKLVVDSEPYSDFVHLMSLVDTANGVVSRQGNTITWGFPNLDLQIHLYRWPEGKWLGLQAQQQYGQDGIGLTSAVLHDIHGPFGRSEQILTLRPLG